jgi:nitroimidazol reductase NimA-like FMN-containing flavoprotein (pyridoxamine 5'-phosphate oxidase superfamily)
MKLFDEPFLVKSATGRRSTKKKGKSLAQRIKALLNQEPYGVLCTQGRGQPYGSLVAFATSGNLKHLYFATPIYTRKYRLLKKNPRVSFVVDSRARYPNDMARVEAITTTGKAISVIPGSKRNKIARVLEQHHPQLRAFYRSSSCSIIQLNVARYFHVTRFQEVSQWVVKKTG